MLQNGQTEPSEAWVTRRRTRVRREVKFVRSKKTYILEKSKERRFFNIKQKSPSFNIFNYYPARLFAF